MLVGIFLGILSAVALIVIMARISLKKFMGYPLVVDIGGSALLCVLFAGTMTGMIVAMIGGLVLSFIVWACRKLCGFEKWSLRKGWVYYPPNRVSKVAVRRKYDFT